MRYLSLLLIILATPLLASEREVIFDCPSTKATVLVNAGEINQGRRKAGIKIEGLNTAEVCPLRTDRRVMDVTINHVHYTWCEPTKNGKTACYAPLKQDGLPK